MTILEIINQIEADKKANCIELTHALKLEVIKFAQSISIDHAKERIEVEIIELEEQGKIKLGETLNDNYIILQQNRL